MLECDAGHEAMAITRAIVSLAHSLNLYVVAEGVEKQSQLAVLNALVARNSRVTCSPGRCRSARSWLFSIEVLNRELRTFHPPCIR